MDVSGTKVVEVDKRGYSWGLLSEGTSRTNFSVLGEVSISRRVETFKQK